MNNRDYKKFAEGVITHVYNRGNNKQKIFIDEQDYKAFLYRLGLALGFNAKELNKEKLLSMPHSRIRIECDKNLFKLHSFCLMPNHFHLLIEQLTEIPTSKLISKVCTSYAKYINKKYSKVGHVFQDCFKANNIETHSQLMWTSSYIHMNPVKDKIVNDPSKYTWSSYNDFTNDRNLIITTKDFLMKIFGSKKEFELETLRLSDVKESL